MTLSVGLALLACSCQGASELPPDAEGALLALHAQILQAHLSNDVDTWMALEAEELISANRGAISFPSMADRRAGREAYLGATRFTSYRDLREPIVRVSADGTLGWVIAEVEVKGVQTTDTGGETVIDDVWAWVELYERQDEGWRLVGNVSNRRP